MRQSIASVAIIQKEQNGQRLWLARWNRKWERYNFVSGHKREDESFRQCIVREIAEELGLYEPRDIAVADGPFAEMRFEAWSESENEQTAYTLQLFRADIIGEEAWEKVEANPLTRWLTEEEIRNRTCADGKPGSDIMSDILEAYGAQIAG